MSENGEKDIRETPINQIVGGLAELLSVKSSDSIQDTIRILKEKNIRTVGVLDESSEELIGLVTVFDIMSWVALKSYSQDRNFHLDAEILAKPIGSIQGAFHEETKQLWSFEEDMPINKTFEPFCKGVYRAVVHCASGATKIITQTDVVKFGLANKAHFPDTQKSLDELNIGTPSLSKVYSIHANEPAVVGFLKMNMENHLAVPVVDPETQQVVATLSSSDIRQVSPERIEDVLLPVKTFLEQVGSFKAPVTAVPTDSLESVMERIVSEGVHRVWVVDEQRRPVGAFSLSDIINRLQGIDEDLQSRPLAVYGRGAMQKLFSSKVLISGMNGLGAEIAKNVILANVNTVTLHDRQLARWEDLNSHFYLSPEDVGKNRALSSLSKLAELNPSVRVAATDEELSDALVAKHNVLVLIEHQSEEQVARLDRFCRERGIHFILTDVNGLAGYVFNDFGGHEGKPGLFEVTDTTGEQPEIAIVQEISKDGRVQCVHDERINFSEGMEVSFSEVQGLDALNHGVYTVVKTTPYSFWIDPAQIESLEGEYKSGGIATEVKRPKTLEFLSFEERVKDLGPCEPPDFSKWDRPQLLHSAYRALSEFRDRKRRLHDETKEGETKEGENFESIFREFPRPGNEDDRNEFLSIWKSQNEGNESFDASSESVRQVLSQFAHGASLVVNPLATVFGGIVGQEVIKAITGKFHPIHQWFYFDAFEVFRDSHFSLDPSEFAPRGSRYDAQIQLLGRTFQEKLMNQRWFLVGSGALGCEFLKNFAMTGLGCGPNGEIVVTDDDVIEKSNLSRQFLFRNWHIHKPKSLCAAEAAREMNPALNVRAKQDRVSPATENVFDDAFWTALDGVCNALDNIKARLYVDGRCIFYEKPLLESGTLGTKCHSQVVIPHLTQHYGAQPDQPEKEAPVCILHNFPHNIQHCLTWGRSEFNGFFEVAPSEVQKWLADPDYFDALRGAQVSEGDIKEKALLVAETLKARCETFEDCIRWARLTFEQSFSNRIAELLFNFPEDAKTSTGAPFWSPPKRFPRVLRFDPNDPLHMQFVIAGANLRASTFGIARPRTHRKPEYFAQVLSSIEVPEFVPAKKQIQTDPNEPVAVEDGFSLKEILAALPPREDVAHVRMAPEEFEKDDDTNFHMDFIGAAANLRARNYSIEEVDKLKAKLIAGRIIPAIATATALATGMVLLELFKLINERPMGDFNTVGAYRNSSINLALPQFSVFEPMTPEKVVDQVQVRTPDPVNHPEYTEEEEVVAYPPGHTVWDKIHVRLEEGFTLRQLLDHFSDVHNLQADMLTTVSSKTGKAPLVYGRFNKNTHERLDRPFVELLSELQEEDLSNVNYVFPEIFLTTKDGIDVTTPQIIVHLKK